MNEKREGLLHFINVYRSLPALWNTNDPQYSNRQAKNQAYGYLLDSFKKYDPTANRETLVKKINSLRTNFRKELKKVEISRQSAVSADEMYSPTLWYFKELMFLVDQETPEESRSSLDADNNTGEYSKSREVAVIAADYETQHLYLANAQGPNSLNETPPKRKKAKNVDKMVDDMYKLAAHHLNKEDDEFLIAAKSYAEKLKKMSPLQHLFADRLIHEVLLEGQLGNLDRNCSINLNSVITPLTPIESNMYRSDPSRPTSRSSSILSEGTTSSEYQNAVLPTPLENMPRQQLLPSKESKNSSEASLQYPRPCSVKKEH